MFYFAQTPYLRMATPCCHCRHLSQWCSKLLTCFQIMKTNVLKMQASLVFHKCVKLISKCWLKPFLLPEIMSHSLFLNSDTGTAQQDRWKTQSQSKFYIKCGSRGIVNKENLPCLFLVPRFIVFHEELSEWELFFFHSGPSVCRPANKLITVGWKGEKTRLVYTAFGEE